MKKLVIWLVVIGVIAVGGWLYLRSNDSPAASSFEVTRRGVAIIGDLTVSISAVGTVQPIRAVEIKSKASGEIIELAAEEGDFVQKGDLLVRLDPTEVRNDYDQAHADHQVARVTLEQRKKELKRQKDLFERNLISEKDYDDARLAAEQANSQFVRTRAALSTNAERLEDTEIRSPINGLVLSREVEEGQIISSGMSSVTGGTLLFLIADMSWVHLIVDVDETDIGRVQTGLPAWIVADAYPERMFAGEVVRIAPMAKVEQNVTMFEVTVLVDNEDGFLQAGMNTDVEMVIDEATGAVLVPVRAVQTRMARRGHPTGAGDSVSMKMAHAPAGTERRHPPSGQRRGGIERYVQIMEDGEIVDRPVKVGLTNLDYAQIIDGVQPGDSVTWKLTSGAMAGREHFIERMRSRSAVPGMRTQKK